MLGISLGLGLRAYAQGGAPPADYVVTSDAEWNTVFANSAATLSGKIVEVSGTNFTERTIDGKDMDAVGDPLIIRSADASSSVPSIKLLGTTRGIDFSGLNFQMTGWPADYAACFRFSTGTFGKLRFLNGTTFRHGYGASLLDFDTTADLPEYERVANVQTATTTSATYALTWKDGAAPSGWIEFFNRGAQTVYVEVGGSGVVATTGSQAVAAGARFRITPLDPATDTHFAILAASGTSEVNARTEIGLSEYLANTFAQESGAVLEDFEIRNCLFRDLGNGVKGLRPTTRAVVMDNDFDRIYQDIIAISMPPGGTAFVFRNLECLPFACSGIAEDLNGDARDPHGDQFQMFHNGDAGTVGPVYYAGNRIRGTARRSGIKSQGIFVSDNDNDPSFTSLYFISTMQVGGAGRALSLGEESTSFKIRDAFIYGATVLDAADLNSDLPFIMVDHDDDGTVYVGKSIASGLNVTDAPWQQDDNLLLSDAANRAAVFPDLADLASATNRAQIEAALTSAAEGAGLGAVASANAVDWTATDPEAVILWANLPSGAHWNAVEASGPSAVTTFPLRRIMNRRASQTVTVGAGTEWRSVDTDGTTEVQAWTSSPGTIQPDQFIQIRATSSATEEGEVTASVTINGFTQSAVITTPVADPTEYLVQGATPGYFVDPSNTPSGTNNIEYRMKLYHPTSVPNAQRMGAQASTGCDFFIQSNGSITATAEDGTGAKFATNLVVAPTGTIVADDWQDIVLECDATAEQFVVTVDGVTTTTPFTASGNGVFQNNRVLSLFATSTGVTPLPTGTRIADASIWLNGSLHKAISNTAATANADAWHAGGDFTQGPV